MPMLSHSVTVSPTGSAISDAEPVGDAVIEQDNIGI